jgi:molybdenum cofactor synthesis domain-containing protein
MTTVSGIIIGDEILTGKVEDTNAPLLIELCRHSGATLERLVVIGDDPADIADEVARCAARSDLVVTSGGVGPTHDDRTVEGVARAFGVGVERSDEVAAMIRAFWGDRFTEGALRMADLPAGSRLVYGSDGLLPLVAIRNVFLLPGIPRLFRGKLASLRALLTGVRPLIHQLWLRSDESRVAPLLAAVDDAFAAVKIGSYPRFGDPDRRVWVTLEGRDRGELDRALDRLLELLPPAEVVGVERSPGSESDPHGGCC